MQNPTTTTTASAQRDNIRFALRWSDGHKLCGVKHVKGNAWKKIIKEKDNFNSALTGLPPTTDDAGDGLPPLYKLSVKTLTRIINKP